MKTPKLKTIAMVLLVILFFMPLVGTMMQSAGASADAKQYDGIGLIVMGIYNLPFFLVSLIGLLLGGSFQSKSKYKASNIAYAISIISSISGTLLMFAWGMH